MIRVVGLELISIRSPKMKHHQYDYRYGFWDGEGLKKKNIPRLHLADVSCDLGYLNQFRKEASWVYTETIAKGGI